MNSEYNSIDEWESARVRVCHDWLRNEMSIAFGKLTNVLEGSVSDPLAYENTLSYLDRWSSYRSVLEALILSSKDVLSPKRYVMESKLADLDTSAREFLLKVAESSWQRLSHPDQVAQRAKTETALADTIFEELRQHLTSNLSNKCGATAGLPENLVKARKALVRLTDVMSELGRCVRF